MADFFLSPAFVIVLLMFYWVPFAVGAWFVDVWKPRREARGAHELPRPKRHMGLRRPAPAGA